MFPRSSGVNDFICHFQLIEVQDRSMCRRHPESRCRQIRDYCFYATHGIWIFALEVLYVRVERQVLDVARQSNRVNAVSYKLFTSVKEDSRVIECADKGT